MKAFWLVLATLLVVFVSCASSAPNRRRRQSSCEDRVPRLCRTELQPHYCYVEHNRRLCCRTCEALRRDTPGCPYGDHNARITRKNDEGREQTFTCSSYIQFYGNFHCENEERFRQYCCESCQQ